MHTTVLYQLDEMIYRKETQTCKVCKLDGTLEKEITEQKKNILGIFLVIF